jgi:hypothetical protein
MNYIQQAIEVINERIAKLQAAREALIVLVPELISLPVAAKPTQPTATAAPHKVRAAVAKAPKAKRGPYKKRAELATVQTSAAPQPKAEAKTGAIATIDAPATFAGAIKRLVRTAAKPLTIQEIINTIQERWPDLADGKDGNNVMVNLSYWASQGKCEKIGRGALATFKVLDTDYFQEIE